MTKPIRRVCVYCASSRQADAEYAAAARRLGGLLADAGVAVVFGGGSIGSMGALADGVIDRGGLAVGVIPRFMYDLEWGHPGLGELHIVEGLHERKRFMIDEVDAVVALPGGCGTFEELLEAITWKRLGLFTEPIVIVNQRDYYRPLIDMLERAVAQRFMSERHAAMWSVVESVDAVLDAIRTAPSWEASARRFANA